MKFSMNVILSSLLLLLHTNYNYLRFQHPSTSNCTHYLIFSLFSLSFVTANFSGGIGLAGTRMSPFWILLVLRMTEVVVTTGTIRCVKLQSNHHHQQTNTQFFYRPDVLPVTQPTVSRVLKKTSLLSIRKHSSFLQLHC